MDVVLGKNLTIEILIPKNSDDIVIWSFYNGKDPLITIATLRPNKPVEVRDAYKNRAFVDPNTGSLTVTSLKKEDSGDYSVNLIQATTETGDVKVRVLGKSFYFLKAGKYSGGLGSHNLKQEQIVNYAECSSVLSHLVQSKYPSATSITV